MCNTLHLLLGPQCPVGKRVSLVITVRIHPRCTPFLEFDQDPDELDHDPTQRNDDYHDQTMPLLVGLIDSATARRSLDVSFPLHADGHEPSIDLEELAAKRTAGGGMLDSIANMANSILGAGNSHLIWLSHTNKYFLPRSCRDYR